MNVKTTIFALLPLLAIIALANGSTAKSTYETAEAPARKVVRKEANYHAKVSKDTDYQSGDDDSYGNDESDDHDDDGNDDDEDDNDDSKNRIGDDNFDAGFNPKERFSLRSPHHGRCLTVFKGHHRIEYLGTSSCGENHRAKKLSNSTFSFAPAQNNLAYISWTNPTTRRVKCARVDDDGRTRFYRCGESSTKYSLSGDNEHGYFHIGTATRGDKRRCLKHGIIRKRLLMRRCVKSEREYWTKVLADDE